MAVKRLADPATFLAEAQSLLLEDEARHDLPLGIAGTLALHAVQVELPGVTGAVPEVDAFAEAVLANATSNKIYTDIGYEPVCDPVDYAFS
ncbi:MAG TPA: hypothetical protein VIG93_03965 [Gaiellaceae bacterium]